MKKILIDTNFLFALHNPKDKFHQETFQFVVDHKFDPVIPEVSLGEVCFLFDNFGGTGTTAKFLQEFRATSVLPIPMIWADYERASEIMLTYREAHFDFVDTVIMAMSERLNITQVCTYDRRDFSIFRPKHCAYLELLP